MNENKQVPDQGPISSTRLLNFFGRVSLMKWIKYKFINLHKM